MSKPEVGDDCQGCFEQSSVLMMGPIQCQCTGMVMGQMSRLSLRRMLEQYISLPSARAPAHPVH